MKRSVSAADVAAAIGSALIAAPELKFTSTRKSKYAGNSNFAGKKEAAQVISTDDSLRVAGEESLARELSGRGMQGVATYRIAPKEELQSPDTAKGWFERGNVEGVVATRPVSSEKRTTYTPGTWTSPYYGTLWGYYGYGWNSVYIPGSLDRETVVVVETTIYSVPKNALVWAAASETTNPKDLRQFVEDLVKASVKEMQKQGLAKGQPR